MRTKHFFCGLLAFMMVGIVAFVAAPTVNAGVSKSMNGTYYKDVKQYGGEQIIINYNPHTGYASVIYFETDKGVNKQYFTLTGRASGGYLVVSGNGVSHGKRTTMKVRITQVNQNKIRVVTGSGRSYYFYR